jgi:thiol-disulfide isomerase/thioredoxin
MAISKRGAAQSMANFYLDSRFRRQASFVILALALASFMTSLAGAQSVPTLPDKKGEGDTPDISIRMIQTVPGAVLKDGETIKLSSLHGKVVLLDVFSSKCPHCIDHAPHLAGIYNQYRQRGFTVLALATDNADRAVDVNAFIAATKIGYPVGFLTAEIIAYFLDPRNHAVPQMVLFGTDGRMVKRLIGWNESNERELRAAIEAQLANMKSTVAPASAGKVPARTGR